MDLSVRVDPEHFEYLRLQKGSLDRLTRIAGARPAWNFAWHSAYERDLVETFEGIRPFLPLKCAELLDVGSGLGGIDILIRRHYEAHGQQVGVALLDGIDDPPVMNLHAKTFNDMRIARNFQVKNGLNPLKLTCYGPRALDFAEAFDLVVSFGSWCFHYPPAEYLEQVSEVLPADAVVILDVRRDSGESARMQELERVFDQVGQVCVSMKWTRRVFRPRAR